MEADFVARGEFGHRGDVVNNPVREIRRGPDEEDGIAVDQVGHGAHVCLVGRCWAGDGVNLDLEVFAGFAESDMCGAGDDPIVGI